MSAILLAFLPLHPPPLAGSPAPSSGRAGLAVPLLSKTRPRLGTGTRHCSKRQAPCCRETSPPCPLPGTLALEPQPWCPQVFSGSYGRQSGLSLARGHLAQLSRWSEPLPTKLRQGQKPSWVSGSLSLEHPVHATGQSVTWNQICFRCVFTPHPERV